MAAASAAMAAMAAKAGKSGYQYQHGSEITLAASAAYQHGGGGIRRHGVWHRASRIEKNHGVKMKKINSSGGWRNQRNGVSVAAAAPRHAAISKITAWRNGSIGGSAAAAMAYQ
jgi:hypothetical protein